MRWDMNAFSIASMDSQRNQRSWQVANMTNSLKERVLFMHVEKSRCLRPVACKRTIHKASYNYYCE